MGAMLSRPAKTECEVGDINGRESMLSRPEYPTLELNAPVGRESMAPNRATLLLSEAIKRARFQVQVPLSTIAHGRSGDKGNHANIAVIAYTPTGYAWLRNHLTADLVKTYFAPLGPSRVERYEAANLLGLNFMLFNVLAGGASRSLRIDTQGKSLALTLLQMPIELPDDHAAMLRKGDGT